MNIFQELWDNFTNFNHKSTNEIVEPSVYVYNDMYPYTFEQTIRVTHHSKPKRRDPARQWKKIKNYRF